MLKRVKKTEKIDDPLYICRTAFLRCNVSINIFENKVRLSNLMSGDRLTHDMRQEHLTPTMEALPQPE